VSGSGTVTITQTGTCTFQYLPIGLNGSTLLNASSEARTVTVNGNDVTVTGIFAVINTAAAAQEGLTITSVSPNVYSGTGQVTTSATTGVTTMTVSASGDMVVTGTATSDGQTVPFTLTITASTTATFDEGGHLQVVLLDPVPSLLSGPAVTTFSYDLADEGTIVQGVAADGVTQLVLRVPDASGGDQVQFTLLNDQGHPSASAEDDGALTLPGSTTFTSNTVTAPIEDTPSGNMAFALYRAPQDFPRVNPPASPSACGGVPGPDGTLWCRTVSIQVQDLTTNETGMATVLILRPPVVFMHGLWSNPADFQFFYNSAPDLITVLGANCIGSDLRFWVDCINYTDTPGVAANGPGTYYQLTTAIKTFKSKEGVAAVQADVVGYSMGGLIARDWVANASVPFVGMSNFNAGAVHKLITIDTPHLGTPLANSLIGSGPFCQSLFYLFGHAVGQNIADLTTNSNLLQTLNKTGASVHLPAIAIAGTASIDQATDDENAFDNLFLGSFAYACNSLLPAGGYEQLLGTSDLIVPEISQQASGLGITNEISVVSVPQNVIHAVNSFLFPDGPDVLNRMLSGTTIMQANPQVTTPTLVINALNTPVSSYQLIQP
jgi:pimeloyl-ACP methyl ester carboxylesterase